jgi:hypothetical protein
MKKVYAGLSLALISAMSLQAAQSLEEAFKEAKTSGQIRVFYIDRDRSGTIGDTQTDRSAIAVGGHLKLETAPINGFSGGVAFYTTDGAGLNSSTHDKINATLFGEDKEGYSILGQAYLKYASEDTTLTIGRQKIDTPLAGSDDARMLPTLFQGVVAKNSSLQNTTLVAAHIDKIAAGTFSNAYGGGALGVHSGYSLTNEESGKFMGMGKYAIGKESDGVSMVAAIYKGLPNTTLQLWDYYAHDILNAIYLQADTKWDCLISENIKPFAAAQYISQSDIGDKLLDEVDSSYYGVKLGAKYSNFTAYGAYSKSDSTTNAAVNGGIITPWGGMPAFTQGMVTRHMFFADTTASKVAASYNFKDSGINLKSAIYYAKYDVGEKNAYKNGTAWDAKEYGFDLQYYPKSVKNLQLRLRGNFPTDFAKGLDWSEYRVIANYNF